MYRGGVGSNFARWDAGAREEVVALLAGRKDREPADRRGWQVAFVGVSPAGDILRGA